MDPGGSSGIAKSIEPLRIHRDSSICESPEFNFFSLSEIIGMISPFFGQFSWIPLDPIGS